MATTLNTPRNAPFTLTRFWGGETKGVCVNVGMGWNKPVNLTRKEAKALATALNEFANGKETPTF
tara:strand:+ start:416 stop:610 length:195 start_codon:yes stop_codon:yes gene_type:complete